MHLVFQGPPGTGKTTIARLIGKIYKSIGILSKGHFLEVDRSKLIGRYIGQTTHITRKVLEEAHGGVLLLMRLIVFFKMVININAHLVKSASIQLLNIWKIIVIK